MACVVHVNNSDRQNKILMIFLGISRFSVRLTCEWADSDSAKGG